MAYKTPRLPSKVESNNYKERYCFLFFFLNLRVPMLFIAVFLIRAPKYNYLVRVYIAIVKKNYLYTTAETRSSHIFQATISTRRLFFFFLLMSKGLYTRMNTIQTMDANRKLKIVLANHLHVYIQMHYSPILHANSTITFT